MMDCLRLDIHDMFFKALCSWWVVKLDMLLRFAHLHFLSLNQESCSKNIYIRSRIMIVYMSSCMLLSISTYDTWVYAFWTNEGDVWDCLLYFYNDEIRFGFTKLAFGLTVCGCSINQQVAGLQVSIEIIGVIKGV